MGIDHIFQSKQFVQLSVAYRCSLSYSTIIVYRRYAVLLLQKTVKSVYGSYSLLNIVEILSASLLGRQNWIFMDGIWYLTFHKIRYRSGWASGFPIAMLWLQILAMSDQRLACKTGICDFSAYYLPPRAWCWLNNPTIPLHHQSTNYSFQKILESRRYVRHLKIVIMILTIGLDY